MFPFDRDEQARAYALRCTICCFSRELNLFDHFHYDAFRKAVLKIVDGQEGCTKLYFHGFALRSTEALCWMVLCLVRLPSIPALIDRNWPAVPE